MGSAAGVLGFLDALNRGVVERGKRQQILDDEDRKRQQAKEDAELRRKEALQNAAMQLGLNTQSMPQMPYMSDELSLEPPHAFEGMDFFDNSEALQPGLAQQEEVPFGDQSDQFIRDEGSVGPLDLTYSQLRQNITEKVQLDEKEAKEAADAKAAYEVLKFGANVGGIDLGPDAPPMLQAVSDIKGERLREKAEIAASRPSGVRDAIDPREAALARRVNDILKDNPELEEIVADDPDYYYTNPRGISALHRIVLEKEREEDALVQEEALVATGLSIMQDASEDLRSVLAGKEVKFESNSKVIKAEAFINESDAILKDIILAKRSAEKIRRMGGLGPGAIGTPILEVAAMLPRVSGIEDVEEFSKLSNLLQRISNEKRKEIFGSALTGVEVQNQIFQFPSNKMDINTILNTLTAFDQWVRQEKGVKIKGIEQLKKRSQTSGAITAESYIPFMPQGLRDNEEYIRGFRAIFEKGTPVEQGVEQGTKQKESPNFLRNALENIE